MADVFFKCRIDGEQYEVDKLTLGEARRLRQKFGLEDLSAFELDDPDYIAALMYAAFSRKHPDKSEAELNQLVDELDLTVVLDSLVSEIDADPQTAAPEGGADGESGTTPESSGDQSSPASTG